MQNQYSKLDLYIKTSVRRGGYFVCHSAALYIWPQFESHRSGGKGQKYSFFGKVSSLGIQNFLNQSHGSYRKILLHKPRI